MSQGLPNMGSEAKTETSRPGATWRSFWVSSGDFWAKVAEVAAREAEIARASLRRDLLRAAIEMLLCCRTKCVAPLGEVKGYPRESDDGRRVDWIYRREG